MARLELHPKGHLVVLDNHEPLESYNASEKVSAPALWQGVGNPGCAQDSDGEVFIYVPNARGLSEKRVSLVVGAEAVGAVAYVVGASSHVPGLAPINDQEGNGRSKHYGISSLPVLSMGRREQKEEGKRQEPHGADDNNKYGWRV